jgi:putative ABC transport system ATP-binding protein
MIPDDIDLNQLISHWHPDPSELSVHAGNVKHFYGVGEARKQVLFDNDLQIRRGEIVIMTGPSGSGKTTLLTLIGTLRSLQEGSLRVLGRELAGVDAPAVVELRKQIGFIFQAHNLFESLTAFQNVRMATELAGLNGNQAKTDIERLLQRLGLGHRVHYKPKSLSGGQKQRVAIARGVVHSPKLILADEPTAALDAESGREVVTMFQELARQRQCTILIVTHDNRILDVADRIVNMVDGRIRSNVLVQRNAIMCRILQAFPIFQNLPPRDLSQLADKLELKRFPPGTDIIRQGEIGDEFFVIGQGEVDILVDGRPVNVLKAGAFFGEVSLLKKQPRNATVRTRGDVTCFVLTGEEFLEVVKASASFEEELRKVLFERQ